MPLQIMGQLTILCVYHRTVSTNLLLFGFWGLFVSFCLFVLNYFLFGWLDCQRVAFFVCFYAFILIKGVKSHYFPFQSFKLNSLIVLLIAYCLRKGFNLGGKKGILLSCCLSCVLAADPTHTPQKNSEQ